MGKTKTNKSTELYQLMKAEQSIKGFSIREIVDRITSMYDIEPNKKFRQQIAVALKKGVNYGIIVKSRNRYRFDPDRLLVNSLRQVKRKQRRSVKDLRKKTKKVLSQRKSRVPKPTIPMPTVPPPPNFEPVRRNLNNEPVTRIIKHKKKRQ